MTVAELIKVLESYPQEIRVAFRCYSESCLLEADDLEMQIEGVPRPDGWIQNKRPDMETEAYLMFPGN